MKVHTLPTNQDPQWHTILKLTRTTAAQPSRPQELMKRSPGCNKTIIPRHIWF